jgi:hypothetical protein
MTEPAKQSEKATLQIDSSAYRLMLTDVFKTTRQLSSHAVPHSRPSCSKDMFARTALNAA